MRKSNPTCSNSAPKISLTLTRYITLRGIVIIKIANKHNYRKSQNSLKLEDGLKTGIFAKIS